MLHPHRAAVPIRPPFFLEEDAEQALQAPSDRVHAFAQPSFAEAMHRALGTTPHAIAPVFLYDDAGSAFFERICELPEYYVTRTEHDILMHHGPDIARCIGPHAELVEFGAGSARKMRLLLKHLASPRRYVPIDVSGDFLRQQAEALRFDHPELEVEPVVGDFMQPTLSLPPMAADAVQRVGLYLGSSIGNFERQEAIAFLRTAARLLGDDSAMLVGIDLVKDPGLLHAAYNDAACVTAAFNLNLLARANRELGTDFNLSAFVHHACYHPGRQRIEMHLVSTRRQTVTLEGQRYLLEEGESIHTESAHKFSLNGFRELAMSAGWRVGPAWQDRRHWFALQWLYRDERPSLPWGNAAA